MRSRTLIATSIIAAAAASLLTVVGGAGFATTAATTAPNRLVAYSDCMRSHGVANFPDPTASEGIPKDKIPIRSPRLRSASTTCEHLMPISGLGPQTTAQPTRTRLMVALSFARCMRDRGVPNFPDPSLQGELTPQMVTAAGIDLHEPALLQAGRACAAVTHGLITRAAVERAVSGG